MVFISFKQYILYRYINELLSHDNYCKRKLLAEFDKSSGLSKSIINREQIKCQNFNLDFDTFSQIENKRKYKLFFTDYGFGYKCNCTKTGCNKFYCQCFNRGRYCHVCNCINCNNKKPDYISSNKRPKESEEKNKTILISCTCTKSGCNKNYCEY